MTEKSRKLLWIDDDINLLTAYVESLKKYGFDLVTASNVDESIKQYKDHNPYVVLADIRMSPPNGIEIIRRLHEINPQALFAVLSSFLYLQKYRDELAALKFPVQLLDKDFPNTNDESFYDRFIKPIEALFGQGVTYSIKSGGEDSPRLKDVNPFNIEYSEFMSLNIREKDALADKAEKLAYKTIENAFSRGKVWVLLCGDMNEVAAFADDMNQIPSEEDILKFAHRLNRAPYQFCQPLLTEDHWTTCSSNISLKNYPTISLMMDAHDFVVHFDTGCPFSVFSYEYLRENNIIGPASHFIKETRRGFRTYRFAVVKNFMAILKSQKTGQTQKILINGKAVREWLDTSYARRCTEECPRIIDHSPGDLCPLRRALIGRNILIDNNLVIVLDGEKQLTHFGDE